MKEKQIYDAVKLGIANLVIVKSLQYILPKYPTLQIFLSASIFHLTTEFFKVNDFYLEDQSEYIDTLQEQRQ